MERETGIEPVTSSLGSWRSTAELLPPNCRQYNPRHCRSVTRRSPMLSDAGFKVKRRLPLIRRRLDGRATWTYDERSTLSSRSLSWQNPPTKN
jgi:hypothetical protein